MIPPLDPAFTDSGDCDDCGGTGKDQTTRYEAPCPTCQGTGTNPRALLRAAQAIGVLLHQRSQLPVTAPVPAPRVVPIPESLVRGLSLPHSQMELVENRDSPRWTALSATASGSHDDPSTAVSLCLDKLITRLVVRVEARKAVS